MKGMLPRLLLLVWPLSLSAAEPVRTAWILGQTPSNASGAVSGIRPDVHSVEISGAEVLVRSAGISLAYLGPLQNAPQPVQQVRQFIFRFPLAPESESAVHAHVPVEYVGAFLNGIPIYNQFEAASYHRQNLWHYDLIGRKDPTHPAAPGLIEGLIPDHGRHSPIIGFALDGYPIYGPWGYTAAGPLRRMRSSYRLRAITTRDRWPDGTLLAPGQYGPPVGAEYPLGTFVEDYEYHAGAGDLDQYNGRFAKTPEYPQGTYAYFLATDDAGALAFPYLLAHEFYGRYHEPAPVLPVSPNSWGVSVGFRPGAELVAGYPADLQFDVRDPGDRPIRYLEYVHERPMHVLIVSRDLEEFAHIHPEVTEYDSWRVRHTFPYGGRYRVYADVTPPGSNALLVWFDVTVKGPPNTRQAAPAESPRVRLVPPKNLRAGEDTELRFEFTDRATQAALQPYLGAWAHVAIAAEGLGSFIHAHPLEEGGSLIRESEAHTHSAETLGPPPSSLRVVAAFPKAGRYKLWLQFQSAGKVETVPFELRVAQATAKPPEVAIPSGAIRIRIESGGFAPARVQIPAGKPVKLAFIRSADPNCGSKVVFPELGITRDVPVGGAAIVELASQKAGELRFACGMGMYRGSIVVK
jgi:hypothetical protein